MKAVTLVALIFSALEMLLQLVYIGGNYLHFQLNYRVLGIAGSFLFVLFLASLSTFFLVLYRNQKS